MRTLLVCCLFAGIAYAEPATPEDRAVADRMVKRALSQTPQAERARAVRIQRRQAERERKELRRAALWDMRAAKIEAHNKNVAAAHRAWIADAPARAAYYDALQGAYQVEAARSLERASWQPVRVIHYYDPWLDPQAW